MTLSAEYTIAVDRRAPLEDDDPNVLEAEEETSRTSAALFEQMDLIFSYRPATIAGVVALLKYISNWKTGKWRPALRMRMPRNRRRRSARRWPPPSSRLERQHE